MNIQLDLFERVNVDDDFELLREEHKALYDRVENMRRGLFARHTELVKLCIRQQQEIDKIREMMVKEVK